jgi:hypothetical protein
VFRGFRDKFSPTIVAVAAVLIVVADAVSAQVDAPAQRAAAHSQARMMIEARRMHDAKRIDMPMKSGTATRSTYAKVKPTWTV